MRKRLGIGEIVASNISYVHCYASYDGLSDPGSEYSHAYATDELGVGVVVGQANMLDPPYLPVAVFWSGQKRTLWHPSDGCLAPL